MFTIVTQYSDFNELSALFDVSPKITWIRFGNLPTLNIAGILITQFDQTTDFLNNSELGCFEIIPIFRLLKA